MTIPSTILQIIGLSIPFLGIYFGIEWRRRKKEYETAADVLSLFYKTQYKISIARNPYSSTPDDDRSKKRGFKTRKVEEIHDIYEIRLSCINDANAALNRLNKIRPEFLRIFGKDKENPFNDISNILDKIGTAIKRSNEAQIELEKIKYSKDNKRKRELENQYNRAENIIVCTSPFDSITAKISNIIKDIEKIVIPKFRCKESWFTKMKNKEKTYPPVLSQGNIERFNYTN